MNGTLSDKIAFCIYSAGGSGKAPVAPGTAGSAVAALFLLLQGRVPGIPAWSSPVWALLVVALFMAGVWASARAEAAFGKDPGVVVIDEVVGMFAALFLIPNTVLFVVGAFFLFRHGLFRHRWASFSRRRPGRGTGACQSSTTVSCAGTLRATWPRACGAVLRSASRCG